MNLQDSSVVPNWYPFAWLDSKDCSSESVLSQFCLWWSAVSTSSEFWAIWRTWIYLSLSSWTARRKTYSFRSGEYWVCDGLEVWISDWSKTL